MCGESRQSWDIIEWNKQQSKLGLRTFTAGKAGRMALATLLPGASALLSNHFVHMQNIILVFLFHTLWRRFHIIQNSHFPSKLSSFK